MSLFLVLLIHFSGNFVLPQHTTTIFVESGSTISPNESAICVAIIQIVGNCLSSSLADRLGRKFLLLASCFGAATFYTILATYSFVDKHGTDVTSFNWLPIVSFSLVAFSLSNGIATLPFTIMTEILDPAVKSAAMTYITASGFLVGSTVMLVSNLIFFSLC